MKTPLSLLVAFLAASAVHAAVVAPPDGKDNPLSKPVSQRPTPTDPKALEQDPDAPPPVVEPGEGLPGDPGAAGPSLTPGLAPAAAYNDEPMVRVDVLMVSVPEDKAIQLILQLRDPAKIGAAERTLIEMIARREAKLEGWPEIVTHSGVRAVAESIVEKRYPIEFEMSGKANAPTPPTPPAAGVGSISRPAAREAMTVPANVTGVVPTSFETRNIGTTLECEPIVSPDRTAITINVVPQLVRFERDAEFPAGTTDKGDKLVIGQPIFSTSKLSTTLTLRDGERRLIHIGKATEDRTRVDFFIIGAKIQVPPAGEPPTSPGP